jgi:excinuclease UvrABC nuclease subunit
MKINRKQRFPRIYHTRQIKAGVDYFGPFVTRGQFSRLKTALERTFKLRPCLYNIRGNDPHPDCMYFQMHTCSRPCNNDIDRRRYLEDVTEAMAFIEGRDAEIDKTLVEQMSGLSSEMKFEEAATVRRRLEKIQRARRETPDIFFSLWNFNYVVILPADSVSRRRAAFVREGSIVDFVQYEVESMPEKLDGDLRRIFLTAAPTVSREHQYDEFRLACNFLVNPLQTVELIPVRDVDKLAETVVTRIRQRRRKRKNSVPAV